jgi:hypothetical protein
MLGKRLQLRFQTGILGSSLPEIQGAEEITGGGWSKGKPVS